MSKLKKLSVKSNVLTESQKHSVRGGLSTAPVGSNHCGAGCKSRCGTKSGSDGGQYEVLSDY